jgi:tetratricopeptide (TPR) repeat protein
MTCAHCGAQTPGEGGLCAVCGAQQTFSPHTRTLPHMGLHTSTGPLRAHARSGLVFEPGQAFGERYTVVEEVGAGGMGQVYKAIDRKLGKTVALKLIRPDTAQQEALERFRRELALAQDVTHPNVCRVHDLGEVDGVVYISMEYVEGQSLEDLIQSVGHLSPKQTVTLGRQICAGLQAVHARGIVHRDLKPGNIMVDRSGHALVMDFGMAYHYGQERLTGEGAVLGTLAYLSPEQARGRLTDERSDLYAVGLVLYEMLTGRRPPGDGGSVPLALRDASEGCPPPSRLAPEVPGTLDTLVMRCLERDPARRFATAADLEQALAHAAAALSSGVSSRLRPGPIRPTRPWPVIAATALAALAIAAAWFAWNAGRQAGPPPVTRPPVVAVLPLANVGSNPQDEYLGVGIADSLITHLAAVPAVTVVSRSAALEAGRRLSDTRALARDLGVTYVVNGGVQRIADRMRVTLNLVRPDDSVAWGREFDGTVDQVFDLQRRMAEALSSALQITLTRADRERLARPPAASVEAYADYARARALLERPDVEGNVGRAVEGFETALRKDLRFALAHAGLGEAYWALYQETKDPVWTARAQAAITEALRLEPDQPQTRFALALLYQGTGRSEAAIDELRRLLVRQPSSDDAHRLLGDILADRGEWEAALAELRRAVALRPEFWRNHSSLGYAYMKTGRHPEAIAAYTRVTQLQPDNSRGFQMLGFAHQTVGDNRQALENYRKAILIGRDRLAYLNMGTIYYDEGRFREAARAYEEVIRLGPAPPVTHANLGDAYARLGETRPARQAYARAVELSRDGLKVNPSDPQTLSRLALYEAKLGRHADARAHIAEAVGLNAADGDILYRQAVVHTLAGRRPAALAALGAAVERGYSARRARMDYDLRTLQGLPEFKAIVAERP